MSRSKINLANLLLALLTLTALSGYGYPATNTTNITNEHPVKYANNSVSVIDSKPSYYRMIVEVPYRDKYHLALIFKNKNKPSGNVGYRYGETMGVIKITQLNDNEILRKLTFPQYERWIGGGSIKTPENWDVSSCSLNLGIVNPGKYLIASEISPRWNNIDNIKISFTRTLWMK